MLRTIAIAAALVLMLEGMSSAAYVLLSSKSTPVSGQVGIYYNSSNKVKLFYQPDLAALAQNYTLAAKHDSGNRTYSTSNLSTAIWYIEDATYKEGVPLIATASFLPTNAGESLYTGWTGM